MRSAGLSALPSRSMAACLSRGYCDIRSTIRSPTSSTGERHERATTVSASATASATMATTTPVSSGDQGAAEMAWPAELHARWFVTSLATDCRGLTRSAEVLEVAARGRAPLALVLRALGAAAVRVLGRCRHRHEADLADLHTGVQRDRQAGDVGELECDVPVEAGVDEPGGAVDQQPEPSETRSCPRCAPRGRRER